MSSVGWKLLVTKEKSIIEGPSTNFVLWLGVGCDACPWPGLTVAWHDVSVLTALVGLARQHGAGCWTRWRSSSGGHYCWDRRTEGHQAPIRVDSQHHWYRMTHSNHPDTINPQFGGVVCVTRVFTALFIIQYPNKYHWRTVDTFVAASCNITGYSSMNFSTHFYRLFSKSKSIKCGIPNKSGVNEAE